MAEKNDFHTFAVLAYRESPYLEDCLLSLIRQTVKSRISIFTSVLSRATLELSEKYDIPLVVNQTHRGIAADWNFAYNHALGTYVTLVHQDDIYLPKYTEHCFSAIRRSRRQDALIVFTWYDGLVDSGIKTPRLNSVIKKTLLLPFMIKPEIGWKFLKTAVLAFGSPIPCPSVMFHKARIGHFNFSESLNCNLDWDAWLRLAEHGGSFVFVNKKLLLHRIYKNSQTSQQIDCQGRKKEDLLIFQRLWPGPVARWLSEMYVLSYKGNRIGKAE